MEMEEAAKSPEIMTFMDKALRSYGEKSLIYVRPSLVRFACVAHMCTDIIRDNILAFQVGERLDIP